MRTLIGCLFFSVMALSGCCTEIVEFSPPVLYGVIPADRKLTLYWSPAIYEERERRCGTHPPDPNFDGYNVYCYLDSTYYDSSRAFHETYKVNTDYITSGTFEIDSLVNGTTYFVHVTAFWNTGSSWISNPGSGIPKADSLSHKSRRKLLLGG
jgi:hypothetical protein